MQLNRKLFLDCFQISKYLIVISCIVILLIVIFNNLKKFYRKDIRDVIESQRDIIIKSCSLYNIKPRMYVSIIYGELKNNFDEWDRFDNFRAKIGMDPSIGFAQIKVSTAFWIEDNYADNKIIFKSNNQEELVKKIINDSINILYSVFYIKLIQDELIKKFQREPSVKTLASYYGRGIDYYMEDQLDSLYYNQIGVTAERFYNSDELLECLPRK